MKVVFLKMNEESFMNLVNENDGFEFVIDYNGKKQEYYVGTYENGSHISCDNYPVCLYSQWS